MSLLMRVLCIVMAFLFVCSFTTSVIGTEAPTLQKAMAMVSSVKIDTQRIVSLLGLTEQEVIPKYVATDDIPWYMDAMYWLANSIADLMNNSFGAVLMIISAVDVVLQVGQSALVFVRAGFYLLFGVDWMANPNGQIRLE